jgi:hypothetical protein
MNKLEKITLIGALAITTGVGMIFYDFSNRCNTYLEGSRLIITAKPNNQEHTKPYLETGFILSITGAGLIGIGTYNKKRE